MASRPLSIFPVDGDFCVDKENAIQLSFKGNAYDFDFASIKVLKETIEKISDKKISDKMISQKKTSQKKSSRKK
jgi:hypothetical protein